jgi:hypothetical protein
LLAARCILLASSIFAFLCTAPAQAPDAGDANGLAREVIEHEIQSQIHDQSLWHYRQLKEEKGKQKRFDVYQTKQGEISRLLEVNGEPLSARQEREEAERIGKLATHPDAMREEQRKQSEDADKARKLLRIYPEAFLFRLEGMEGTRARLHFAPNPNYDPSGREAEVLHHMEGNLLVDVQQKRLAEIEGTLQSSVKFAGGLLGHLDQGGTFRVKQKDLGSGAWQMELLHVNMNGKALFFKTIAVHQTESSSDFQPLPADLTVERAVRMLLNGPNK